LTYLFTCRLLEDYPSYSLVNITTEIHMQIKNTCWTWIHTWFRECGDNFRTHLY